MTPITVYLYSKCSTCQDAQRFLETHNIPFTRKEITETPPSVAELRQMLKFKDGEIKKLFNTSGMLYREMKLNEKLNEMTLDQALELLSSHGMLVKRPFLIGKKCGLLGYKEQEWQVLTKE